MKYLIAFVFFIVQSVYAFNSDNLLHPVAHAGGSYVITHAGQVICHKLTSWNKTACTIVGASVATAAGIGIELTQKESQSEHFKSYIQDVSGIVLAIGIIHLDF